MEIAGLIVSVLSLLIAGAAVLYARTANRRSADANDLSAQALDVQRAALPPEWSAIEHIGETTVGFRNQSSRDIVVTDLAVEPDTAAELVEANPRPNTIEYGDILAIRIKPRYMSAMPHRLTITWHFADDPEKSERTTARQM